MGARRPLTPEARLDRDRRAQEMENAIEQMTANGLTPQEITLLTGLKPHRLYSRYRDVMVKGAARRTNEVAQSVYMMATGGGAQGNWRQADASMAKFWLERRGGPSWALSRDDDAGPDLSRLTEAELKDLHRALQPLQRGLVMIDVQANDAEPGRGDGGAVAAGAGDQPAGGGGVDLPGEGEVSS